MTLSFHPASGLTVMFDTMEMVWGIRFHREIRIPAEHVKSAWLGMPTSSWKELRVPGSFVPGLIKAGRYLTPRGTEFWYVTRKKKQAVTIELAGEAFNRLVLGFEDGRMIAESGLTLSAQPDAIKAFH